MSQETIDAAASSAAASASAAAFKVSMTGSAAAIFGGISGTAVAAWGGLVIGLLGLIVNWYYKAHEFQLRQIEHNALMGGKTQPTKDEACK